MSNATQVTCANCGQPIERPRAGSYPHGVEWVHVESPIGKGNRYCGFNGGVAKAGRA